MVAQLQLDKTWSGELVVVLRFGARTSLDEINSEWLIRT